MNVNSNAYTYTFATVMVVLVAVLLSGASLGLKSKQASNISQEKKQSILASIGIEVDRSESDEAFGEYIKQSLTLEGGTVVSEDASAAFDIDMAAAIKAGQTILVCGTESSSLRQSKYCRKASSVLFWRAKYIPKDSHANTSSKPRILGDADFAK